MRDRLTGNVTDLQVGDCFDLPAVTETSNTVEDVQHHPCTEPHLYEAFAEHEYPGADSVAFPGSRALEKWAEQKCNASFLGYVGTSLKKSSLVVSFFTPSAEGWDEGDRVVNCILLTDPPEKLTVSLKASAR
jgi:hypothetical protein